MAFRVIQWATGNVGRAAVEGILAHPELELVGAWVHSPEKAGRDVGELCGLGPTGVVATDDEARVLALDADCVLYSPLLPDTSQVRPHPRVGQERRHAARLVLSLRVRRRDRDRDGVPAGARDPPRHRHPPRRDHRAVSAHALRALEPHPARACGGVLRHSRLPGGVRGAGDHAVREDAGGGA